MNNDFDPDPWDDYDPSKDPDGCPRCGAPGSCVCAEIAALPDEEPEDDGDWDQSLVQR